MGTATVYDSLLEDEKKHMAFIFVSVDNCFVWEISCFSTNKPPCLKKNTFTSSDTAGQPSYGVLFLQGGFLNFTLPNQTWIKYYIFFSIKIPKILIFFLETWNAYFS